MKQLNRFEMIMNVVGWKGGTIHQAIETINKITGLSFQVSTLLYGLNDEYFNELLEDLKLYVRKG
jgi:hypothetical protein